MTWRDGAAEIDSQRYSPSLALLVDIALDRAVETHASRISECLLLDALLAPVDDAALLSIPAEDQRHFRDAAAMATNHLAAGVTVRNCLDAFAVVTQTTATEINPFDREAWDEPLGRIVDDLPDGAGIPDLLQGLLAQLMDLPNGDLLLALFDTERLGTALASLSAGRRLVTGDELDLDVFTPRAAFLVERTLELAARTGAEQADAALLLVVMLRFPDTYTQLVAHRVGVSLNNPRAANFVDTATTVTAPNTAALATRPDSLSPALLGALEEAFAQAVATGQQAVGEREILSHLVRADEARLRYLVDDVLAMPLRLVDQTLAQTVEPVLIEPTLPSFCPARNATAELTRPGAVAPVPRDEPLGAIIQVFFRRHRRAVLLHAERGCGSSAMADVVAAALLDGRFPALRHTQVIVFDLGGVDEDDYTRVAGQVLNHMDDEPDRIYVVEGFGRYFVEHFAACARRFAHATYRLLILADPADHTSLMAGPEPLVSVIDTVELPEPTAQETGLIVEQAAARIAEEYQVTISSRTTQAAIRMAGDYMLAARFPAKAVALLESAAADVAAMAEMRGTSREVERTSVARRVSTITGLPIETILGTGQDKDYVDLLSTNLVGQEVAVLKVAGRLDLIQKGMVDKKLPAAVFIFAGLSGTGKTELAKQIAQIYSQSHAMITFPMENFGESHSVSKIIGSPPGYAGFDEGGPLVNALNRDPYSVVLLDEVEKAHPAVWDPFLHLFDEGTITDSKGVSASGTKAFFVMTSNIGQYEIAAMLARGASQAEIEESVMAMFPAHLHDQARIPCFRPEFIGRVMRCGGIVAFNALSREALLGIAKHSFAKIARSYAEVHEGRFICDDDVLEMIAEVIYQENEQVIRESRPGYLGARRIQQLMDQHINNKLAEKIRQVAGAPLVRVVLNGRQTELVPVYSDGDAEALLAERRTQLVGRVERRFNQILATPDDAFAGLSEQQLNRLDRLFSEVGAIL